MERMNITSGQRGAPQENGTEGAHTPECDSGKLKMGSFFFLINKVFNNGKG